MQLMTYYNNFLYTNNHPLPSTVSELPGTFFYAGFALYRITIFCTTLIPNVTKSFLLYNLI